MFDRTLVALLLLVAPATLFANPQFQTEPRAYTARGTVVNSVTGEAISGALVQINGGRQHAMLTGPMASSALKACPMAPFRFRCRSRGIFRRSRFVDPADRPRSLGRRRTVRLR